MIPLPFKPKVTETGENKALFEISALYPGYGITIGSSLRRVLLSSLPGAAVTQVKIKGVQHEFSTIPNVLEDVIMIILNLKKLRFKLHGDESQTGIIKVKGEKEIKGKDIELPSQVEIVSKDVHIATLTAKKAELEMEIQIENGIGYESVERRKKEKLEIGVIALDAVFSPIKRVSYKVENMRVGERTDFDKLTLEIETDGVITPRQAFQQALEILIKHFSLFVDEKEEIKIPEGKKKPKRVLKDKKKPKKAKKKK
ncbi:hypothetical protein AMJ49_05775 [Parcubacteria bacterium DG_74_2]|nr:MAG: hypothetical protein AMJ49_05775 [Parcubacteria bacterium DG_74_2]